MPLLCEYTDTWIVELTDATVQPIPGFAHDVFEATGLVFESAFDVYQTNANIDLSDVDRVVRWSNIMTEETSDFMVGTTIDWGPGDSEDYCGLQIRATEANDSYYLLEINRNGNLMFLPRLDNEWQSRQTINLDYIRTDINASNVLNLIAVGDKLRVFINVQLVEESFDISEVLSAEVDHAAETFAESDESYCDFRDTWVWEIPEGTNVSLDTLTNPAPFTSGRICTSVDRVNVRSGTSEQTDDIATLANGTSITITERNSDNSWSRVMYGDIEGWVRSDLICNN